MKFVFDVFAFSFDKSFGMISGLCINFVRILDFFELEIRFVIRFWIEIRGYFELGLSLDLG